MAFIRSHNSIVMACIEKQVQLILFVMLVCLECSMLVRRMFVMFGILKLFCPPILSLSASAA